MLSIKGGVESKNQQDKTKNKTTSMQNIDNKNASHDSDSDTSDSDQSSQDKWKHATCKHKFSFFQARPATGQPSSSNSRKQSALKRCYTEPIPLDLAKKQEFNKIAYKLINEANEEHSDDDKPQQEVDEESAIISHNLLVTEGSGAWYLKVKSNCDCMCQFEVFIDNKLLSAIPSIMPCDLEKKVDLYDYTTFTKRIVPAFQDLDINEEGSGSEKITLLYKLMSTGMGTIRITTYKASKYKEQKAKQEKKKKKQAVISVSKPEFVNGTSSVPLLVPVCKATMKTLVAMILSTIYHMLQDIQCSITRTS